jgi:hypothetical protein
MVKREWLEKQMERCEIEVGKKECKIESLKNEVRGLKREFITYEEQLNYVCAKDGE